MSEKSPILVGDPHLGKCPTTYFGTPVEPYYVFDFNTIASRRGLRACLKCNKEISSEG